MPAEVVSARAAGAVATAVPARPRVFKNDRRELPSGAVDEATRFLSFITKSDWGLENHLKISEFVILIKKSAQTIFSPCDLLKFVVELAIIPKTL
ncbi:hypothetical protein GCM10028818_47760 [Spirosoma horti]